MKILLLDAREFAKVKGEIFLRANYYSYNMKEYTTKKFSNGWCPVSCFKFDLEGNVYGRIANELVPPAVYHNLIIETNEIMLVNKYKKAIG